MAGGRGEAELAGTGEEAGPLDGAEFSEWELVSSCTLAFDSSLRGSILMEDDDVELLVSTVCAELEEGRLPQTPAGLLERLRDVVTNDVFPSIEDEDLQAFSRALHRQLVACAEAKRDEGDLLEPGECEMCDRKMPLTRHHLIPRSQHKEYKRLGYPQKQLEQCALVCRQCHSALHQQIDEATLAASYNTVELLLKHEGVRRFCAWASKQKGRNPRDIGLRVQR